MTAGKHWTVDVELHESEPYVAHIGEQLATASAFAELAQILHAESKRLLEERLGTQAILRR